MTISNKPHKIKAGPPPATVKNVDKLRTIDDSVLAGLGREAANQGVWPGPIGSPSWRTATTPAEAKEYKEACRWFDDLPGRVPYLLAALQQDPRRRDALRQLLEPIVLDVLAGQQGGAHL